MYWDIIPSLFCDPSTFLTRIGHFKGCVRILCSLMVLECMNDPSAPELIRALNWKTFLLAYREMGICMLFLFGFVVITCAMLTLWGPCFLIVPLAKNPL